MYTIDTGTFSQFIHTLWALMGGALTLDPAAFRAVAIHGNATWVSLVILFLAGISSSLGQCVVLMINQVTRTRFIFSLLASGALLIVNVYIWIGIFLLVGHVVFDARQPILEVLRVVSLAFAPSAFGFFVLLPYLGRFIQHVLEIWTYLAIVVALMVTLQIQLWQAMLGTLVGWIIIQGLQYSIGRPIVAFEQWLQQIIAGTPLAGEAQFVQSIREQHTTPTSHSSTEDESQGGQICP